MYRCSFPRNIRSLHIICIYVESCASVVKEVLYGIYWKIFNFNLCLKIPIMFIFSNCSHCLYKLKAMCPMIDTAMRILSELPRCGRVSL